LPLSETAQFPVFLPPERSLFSRKFSPVTHAGYVAVSGSPVTGAIVGESLKPAGSPVTVRPIAGWDDMLGSVQKIRLRLPE